MFPKFYRIDVSIAGGDSINLAHDVGIQEAQIKVFGQSFRIGCLWYDRSSSGDGPTQEHLCRRHPLFIGDLVDCGVFEEEGSPSRAQGGVGDDADAVLFTISN